MIQTTGTDLPDRTTERRRQARSAAIRRRPYAALALLVTGMLLPRSFAQTASAGAPELAFAGLRVASTGGVPAGQINGIATTASGAILLLIDQKDGIRLIETDKSAGSVLAEAHLGATGDIGLALALDPSGAAYVAGTTSSGSLAGSPGAAFPFATGTGTNSFVAKFDSELNLQFVTFTGADPMAATGVAATSDAVFVTGTIFSATLPVTTSAVIGSAAMGTFENGFVERFSSDGSKLNYATYLSGAGGVTSPATIVADSADNAYVAGYTSAAGLPTNDALVPQMIGTTSGFMAKLAPGGDSFAFSTFIPGGGITSLAVDAFTQTLLVSGMISVGDFPVAVAQGPMVPLPYQVLVRMQLDGSSLISSTALAPGQQSFVAADASGGAWVDGSLSVPLFPGTPLGPFGNSFAMHVSSAGAVDGTTRFGGLPVNGSPNATAPVNVTSIAISPEGEALIAGGFAPVGSADGNAKLTFDLPLVNSPTAAFPAPVHESLLPATACTGSTCAGSAAYLAALVSSFSAAGWQPSLALSVDDAPNLTLRNLAPVAASGLEISASGFGERDNCGAALAPGAECSILLTGNGSESITVSAANAAIQTRAISADYGSGTPQAIVFSPRELDFGVASAAAAPVERTLTVTNLSGQEQTFSSAWIASPQLGLPYTFAEAATDCSLAGGNNRLLEPGASCHVTLSLTPSADPSNTGAIQSGWMIGARMVQLTGYGQAAGLSLSAAELRFGTQYTGQQALPRYLYLSNYSGTTYTHRTVALSASSPFAAEDECPASLAPGATCRIRFDYSSAQSDSSDSLNVTLDQGLTVLLTGETRPGASSEPALVVSATALSFAAPVAVNETASAPETLVVTNAGTSSVSILLTLSGADFADTSDCGPVLTPAASCSVVISFSPVAAGLREGMLSVAAGNAVISNSSNPNFSVSVPLSGTGTAVPSFALTAGEGSSVSATVKAGASAVFTLAAASTGGFVGQVALTCAPVTPVNYGSCSVTPASLSLNGVAQSATATATITTQGSSAVAEDVQPGAGAPRSFAQTALALLLPAMLFSWKARTSQHRAWRRALPIAWTVFAAVALLTSSGCAGAVYEPVTHTAATGTYQYKVIATAVGTGAPATQTVMLTLTVTP